MALRLFYQQNEDFYLYKSGGNRREYMRHLIHDTIEDLSISYFYRRTKRYEFCWKRH